MTRFPSTARSFIAQILAASLAICAVAVFAGTSPASAQDANPDTVVSSSDSILEQVDASYICMITNKVFDSKQIKVPVDGRTYYGCCQMCVKKLSGNPESRYAVDPVGGERVNKADAVLGAGPDGTVHHFESAENLRAFTPSSSEEGGRK